MALNLSTGLIKDAHLCDRIMARSELLQISGVILLGLVMLFGVGFAQAHFSHGAAHDSRHSVSFPCH